MDEALKDFLDGYKFLLQVLLVLMVGSGVYYGGKAFFQATITFQEEWNKKYQQQTDSLKILKYMHEDSLRQIARERMDSIKVNSFDPDAYLEKKGWVDPPMKFDPSTAKIYGAKDKIIDLIEAE